MSTRTICLLTLTAVLLGAVAWNSVEGSGLEFWSWFGVAVCGVAVALGACRAPRGPEPLAPFSEYQEIDR